MNASNASNVSNVSNGSDNVKIINDFELIASIVAAEKHSQWDNFCTWNEHFFVSARAWKKCRAIAKMLFALTGMDEPEMLQGSFEWYCTENSLQAVLKKSPCVEFCFQSESISVEIKSEEDSKRLGLVRICAISKQLILLNTGDLQRRLKFVGDLAKMEGRDRSEWQASYFRELIENNIEGFDEADKSLAEFLLQGLYFPKIYQLALQMVKKYSL